MSHKFHGKASGKMKTEKRMKKQQDEMVKLCGRIHLLGHHRLDFTSSFYVVLDLRLKLYTLKIYLLYQ